MRASIGRIVLVKSPTFTGECAAIVTKVVVGEDGIEIINVRVFTDVDSIVPHLQRLQPQSESHVGWGWRWPPRESEAAVVAAVPAADQIAHI